ncbi:MAG TPA: acetylxylan esterase [Candidatus Hydrogenedentes bacterium]|nr:acetylxylan esterase [Candidatus Hydrogenedentota bacterium]
MFTMAMAAFIAMTGQGSTVWFNACEIDPAGISLPEKGSYGVWGWIPVDYATSITINGQTFPFERKKEKNDPDYVWVKAGDITLNEEKAMISVGEKVMGVVLSTALEFAPSKVMKDMRVYDQPRGVADRRALTAKHTDTVFVMPYFNTKDAWEAFAAKLRRRILLSSGLLPLPEKTSLKAKIFDLVKHDDYTVEKVHFEARPGFLVTGNLYRPVGKGPFPGVVCPHGHWEHGRLNDDKRGSVPGRCITLARMGIVAFSYDMIGYVDSQQFPHNWGGEREKLWGIHPFAMQLWSSIRAVDFITSLPEVDPQRIGCTGASGGGTQTFALCSVEPRICVAAPVNMISSTMQGGCLCENAPIIRLCNSNMEIGALMAPKPLLMVSASGDWTRETPHVEYPSIRGIYALYGAEDRVQNVPIDAEHNYNQSSREAMYRFFGKWLLGGDHWANYTEPAFTVEEESKLRVFPDKDAVKKYPSRGKILESIIKDNQKKWDAVFPKKEEDVETFRKDYGDVLAAVTGAEIPRANDLALERVSMEERKDQGYVVERWIIGRAAAGDAIPALFYRSYATVPQDAVLIVHGKGKAFLADGKESGPGGVVKGLIEQGKAVLCIDAFLIGEHHAPDKRTERLCAGKFMDTFQPTDTGCRIQDVLTALAFLRARRDMTGQINLIGLQEGGMWCLFASAIDGQVPITVVDLNAFPVDNDEAWEKEYYIPCIRSIGDVRTSAALIAPRSLLVMNASDAKYFPWARIEEGMLDNAALMAAVK